MSADVMTVRLHLSGVRVTSAATITSPTRAETSTLTNPGRNTLPETCTTTQSSGPSPNSTGASETTPVSGAGAASGGRGRHNPKTTPLLQQ